jgi:hypothetical protein
MVHRGKRARGFFRAAEGRITRYPTGGQPIGHLDGTRAMYSASAVYHDPTTLELATPFHRGFVDALNVQIPAPYRRWEPESRTWFVESPYDATAIRILRTCFPHADIGKKPGERPYFTQQHGCACDDDHKALYVCQSAPLEVIRAAYGALAKVHHPDAGGNTTDIQRLNSAYARLADEVRS